MLSEEEIIKVLSYQLSMKDTDVYTPINYEAIQGLLDLYIKQQKEIERKNKLIEKNRIALENCLKYRSEEKLLDENDE